MKVLSIKQPYTELILRNKKQLNYEIRKILGEVKLIDVKKYESEHKKDKEKHLINSGGRLQLYFKKSKENSSNSRKRKIKLLGI